MAPRHPPRALGGLTTPTRRRRRPTLPAQRRRRSATIRPRPQPPREHHSTRRLADPARLHPRPRTAAKAIADAGDCVREDAMVRSCHYLGTCLLTAAAELSESTRRGRDRRPAPPHGGAADVDPDGRPPAGGRRQPDGIAARPRPRPGADPDGRADRVRPGRVAADERPTELQPRGGPSRADANRPMADRPPPGARRAAPPGASRASRRRSGPMSGRDRANRGRHCFQASLERR